MPKTFRKGSRQEIEFPVAGAVYVVYVPLFRVCLQVYCQITDQICPSQSVMIKCLSCYSISLIRIIPKTIEDLIKDVWLIRRAFLPELKYHGGSCRAYGKNTQHFVNRPRNWRSFLQLSFAAISAASTPSTISFASAITIEYKQIWI